MSGDSYRGVMWPGHWTPEKAERRYPPPSLADAAQIAKEMIDEWDYFADPHGYCHVRPMLVTLLLCAEAKLNGL